MAGGPDHRAERMTRGTGPHQNTGLWHSRWKMNDPSRLSPDSSLILRPRSSKKWYIESFKISIAIERKVYAEGMLLLLFFLMPKVLHSQGTWKLAKCSDCVWNSYDGDSEIVSELARHTALKRWIATEILWYRKAVSCGSAVQRITLLPISVRKCWASSARGPSVLLLLIRPTTTLHLKRRLWKVCNKWPHTTDTVRIRYMHESRTKKCTKIT